MSDKEKKAKILSLEERKNLNDRRLAELEIKNRILGSPELFPAKPGDDDFLDELSLKVKLRGGAEFTIEEYLSATLVDYERHFPQEYFNLIAILYGRPVEEVQAYATRPQYCRDFLFQFTYGRFPQKVVNTLMQRSPWTEIPGVRANRLFQRLSPIATVQLDLFIEQQLQMMREYVEHNETLTHFKIKYSSAYRLYFQIDMFRDISINP